MPPCHDNNSTPDAGCWREPLPYVTKTATMLVSKLAVLFHTMAEDIRSVAEGAGLKWQWRTVQGRVMDEGSWEGDCDKVRKDAEICARVAVSGPS